MSRGTQGLLVAWLATGLSVPVYGDSGAGSPGRNGGPKVLSPIGRMDPAVVKESSGLAKSPKYEGIFWTHGDSGNPAELYAIKTDGTRVAKVPVVDAPNLDWEDLAMADGFLYVGDIGNNSGWLRVRMVYKFAEPDPYTSEIQPVKPLAVFRYKFPEGPFDAEALVARGDRLYIIRKAGPGASAIYRLVPGEGGFMTLTKIQTLPSAWITGADLSADGRFLVTISGYQLSLFPVKEDLTLREEGPAKFLYFSALGAIEACCFDGDDVLLTSEQGDVYRISAEDIQRQTRFTAPKPGGPGNGGAYDGIPIRGW